MKLDPGQVSAFMRHVYTALGVLAAAIGGASFVDPAKLQAVLTSVHQIGDGVVSIATGIAGLIPVASGVYAMWTASHTSKMTTLAADPQTPPQVKQAVNVALAKAA